MRRCTEAVVTKSTQWHRVAIGGGCLLLYVHFLLLATQASRDIGPHALESGLTALPPVIPFGVISLWQVLTICRPSTDVTVAARVVAGGLLVLFLAFSAFCWASWNAL
jgi:hypothetical protein